MDFSFTQGTKKNTHMSIVYKSESNDVCVAEFADVLIFFWGFIP